MAEMKYLNTRVQMKYDSFENWSKAENQKDLLAGEIAIAYLGPTQTTTANPDNGTHPVLFKVGPGKFNDLPWASALAADVYSWAKQSENDFVSKFLALKMSDGTTMQTKLDAVFATDAALAKAIEDIRKEIPTALGVMSVDGSNAIKATGTDNVTVSLALDNSGNVQLSQSNTGLKAAVDLSAYRKIAEDEDTITIIAQGANITVSDAGTNGNHAYTITGKDWTNDIATAISNSASTEGGVISNVIAKADAAQEAADEAMDKAEEGVTKAEAAQIAAEAAQKTIDDFLKGEEVDQTVDTLKEIQAELERLGDAVELETQFAAKADKVKNAAKGNFAGLDENGNLTDSGKKAADFATAAQGAKADDALPTATFNSTIANYYTKTEADAEFMDADEVSAAITNALTGADATVKVQNAVNADNAKEAAHALNADNATNATNAVNAENAIRAEDATHADAAAKVDKSLTITAGSSNTVFDGSAEKTLNLDNIYLREHQDLSNYKTKQDPYSNAGSNVKTVTGVTQNANGEIAVTYANIAFPAAPVVNDGTFTVSGTGSLTGSGSMTANQAGNTTASLDIAAKGVTTAKIADHAVGALQTKADKNYTGSDAEVWVFYCGNASTLI